MSVLDWCGLTGEEAVSCQEQASEATVTWKRG